MATAPRYRGPMGSDRIEEMKSIEFPVVLRGYDRYVVDAYISELREWLSNGGEDEARREEIRREMERVGERTGSVLAEAQRIADELRAEAEQEVAKLRADVDEEVAARRKQADEYMERVKAEADAYAEKTRAEAEANAKEKAEAAAIAAQQMREEAEEYAAETRAKADGVLADAEAEAARRTKGIEREIAALVRKRQEVISNLEQLQAQMRSAIAGPGEEDLELPTRVQEAVEDPDPTQPMTVADPDDEPPTDETKVADLL